MDRRLEILDQPEDVRDLVAQCELTGKRTLFERNGRVVAVLVSHDEYLALKETIAITNDAPLRGRLETAEAELARGAMLLVEDLLVE
jgi:PHD/YefM family antitoxin component YafN of YafNO toxin-antitoxin module